MHKPAFDRIAIAVIAGLALPIAAAQSTADQPHFDVAVIKRVSGPCAGGQDAMPAHGRLHIPCVTLQNLIQVAYGVLADGKNLKMNMLEVSGGPSWVQSDFYELDAKAEGDLDLGAMGGPMLRSLLEERFQLKVHRDSKEAPAYFLTVGKSGSKLVQTKEGSCIPIDLKHLPQPPAPGQPMPKYCGAGSNSRMAGGVMKMNLEGATMENFTSMLTRFAGRPVIDKTGLAGMYDVHLEFTPERFEGRGAEPGADLPAPAGPSIFTAVQEQLGLKLESGKGPVETLVVDHVERPTEN